MSLLRYFDLFKSPIFFLYKGRTTISTNLGFLFSLLLTILLINSAAHSDFFYKSKPFISLQSDFSESYAPMWFDRSNFSIIVKIANYSGISLIDYSYFYFNLTFNSLDLTQETYIANENYMKICDDNDFIFEGKELNLSGKAFCPRQQEHMILKGAVTSTIAQYAILRFNRCDQYSAKYFNVTCKSVDEMNEYIANKVFYLYYTDNTFDLTNLNKPVHRSLLANTLSIYPNIKKTTIISVQKTLIQTDLGESFLQFGNSHTAMESYRIGGVTSDFSYDTTHFHEIFFISDRVTQKMTRSYLKLQDLLAVLGGISSTYIVIAGFFVSNYKQFLLYFEVFSHFFVYSDINEKDLKKPEKIKKISVKKHVKSRTECSLNIKSKNLPPPPPFPLSGRESCMQNVEEGKIDIGIIRSLEPNIGIPPIATQMSEDPLLDQKPRTSNFVTKISSPRIEFADLEKEKSLLSVLAFPNMVNLEKIKKSRGIDVKYWEYLKFELKKCFGFKLTRKESFIQEAQNNFLDEMDVLKILGKIGEVNKLKSIIFDPVQKNVFDIYAKQKIELAKEKNNSKGNVLQEFSTSKRKNTTELDQRLLNSLKNRV